MDPRLWTESWTAKIGSCLKAHTLIDNSDSSRPDLMIYSLGNGHYQPSLMVQASSLIYTPMPCLNGAEAFIDLAMLMGKYQPHWRSCHMRKHKQDITVYSNYTVNAMKSSYCFRSCIFSCNFTRGTKFRTMVCTSTQNVLIILLPRQQRCSANLCADARTKAPEMAKRKSQNCWK